MLTGGCSFVQILVTISVFTAMPQVDLSADSAEVTTYRLYIALACFDFLMLIASFLLVYGNELTNGVSRCHTLPWLILLPFYFIYETGINIFYFYHQLNSSNRYKGPLDGGFPAGFSVVPFVYWISKAILMFTSFLYLVSHLPNAGSSPKVKYVRQVESCHDYDIAPTFPHPAPRIALPAPPTITRPSAPRCTSCSGGCAADRCKKCNLPQPLYGYAGMQSGITGNTSGMGNAGITTGMPPAITGNISGMQLGNVGNIGGMQPRYTGNSAGMQVGNIGSSCGMQGKCGGNSSGMQMGNNVGAVQSKGWTTSIYNTGRD